LNVYAFLDIANYTGSPEGYETYSPGLIEGFMNGILGMKKGETKIIHIDAKDAYGATKLKAGDTFSTKSLLNVIDQTVEVTKFTDGIISVKWIDVESIGNFTSPPVILGDMSSSNQDDMIIYLPPCYLFKNSSRITNITDGNVTVLTTPTLHDNISETTEWIQSTDGSEMTFVFPDVTTAEWNDTTITITSIPEVGSNYAFSTESMYGVIDMDLLIVSVDVANNSINVSVTFGEETSYQLVNTTLTFDRSFVISRFYNNIPAEYVGMLFAADLEREGISIDALAGEDLDFEVTIDELYKTSQTDEES